jgi:hypothetical protein
MLRALLFIKGVDLQPAIIGGIAGRPDDAAHPRGCQVELGEGLGQAIGVGQEKARFRLFRQRQPVAGDILIRGVEQRQIGGIAATDIVRQIGTENGFALGKAVGLPDQGDP